MPEQTPQEILDAGNPNRIPDAIKRLELGTGLLRLASPVTLSDAAGTITIDTNTATFRRPVLSIVGMTATENGQNAPVGFIPTGSAVAPSSSTGTPVLHMVDVDKDANGLIESVTFTGAPTTVFAEVVEAPDNWSARIAADLST